MELDEAFRVIRTGLGSINTNLETHQVMQEAVATVETAAYATTETETPPAEET